jgi:hypothetical protein
MKIRDLLEVTGLFSLGVGGFLFGAIGIVLYLVVCGAAIGLVVGSAVWMFNWVVG